MQRALMFTALFAAACGSDPQQTSEINPIEPGAGADAGGAKDAGASAPVVRDAGGPKPGPTAPDSGELAPGDVCQAFEISTGRVVPDMLIVLDRSGSMRNDDVNRWDPSVSGLTSITAQLETQIRFGLMSFPGSSGSDDDDDRNRCAPGELDVPIELQNAAPIATRLMDLQPNGSTPTASTLEAAHKVISAIEGPADMAAKGTPYVVLVTDGAPNCSANDPFGGGGGGGGGGFDQAAFQSSIAAIEAMAKDGIKTFVLGYDAASDPQLKMSLDAMAVAGGTGETEHMGIENEMGLIDAFTAIAGKAVSCDFSLSTAPKDPTYVRVKLGDQPLVFGDANGWTLSPDKLTLTLQGSSCGQLAKVQGAAVSVKVECNRDPLI